MNITVIPKPLHGTIQAVESKSHAHRLLIVAALGAFETTIRCLESSADITATVQCLNALGANIQRTPNGYQVFPFQKTTKKALLDCGESGSTLRFLLPVIGALGINADIRLHGRLPQRPLTPMWEELIRHGMQLSKPEADMIHCEGQLSGGVYTIPGNISSQFISGLLLALPHLNNDSQIRITEHLESENYIDMTLNVLKTFGIRIQKEKQTFSILGNQSPIDCREIQTEGDWSNAAFWLCAGACSTNGVICQGLDRHSLQGDKDILPLLQQFGAKTIIHPDSIEIQKAPLYAHIINAEHIPDLVPILAVLATQATGKTIITNAQRLRIKESDRLLSTSEMLKKLGANIEETSDGLIIFGGQPLSGGTCVSTYNDHRIAMSAAIASTFCQHPVTIRNAEAVNKSYPKFWEHFKALGGTIIKEDTVS